MFGKNELTDFFGDIYRAGAQGLKQGATIDESIFLNAGKFSVPLQKAIDIVSKTVRFPFTGAITAETNRALYLALQQPIINESTVSNPKVRKAALQLRKYPEQM